VLMGAGVCHDTFCAPRRVRVFVCLCIRVFVCSCVRVRVLVCSCAVACLMYIALLMSIRARND